MAYTPGLYTAASAAAATERERYAKAQELNEQRAARERAGLMRQQQAGLDQFTAGLTPRSDVAVPDFTAPAAPPMPSGLAAPKSGSGGGADSGGAAGASYERDRLMQERKLVETQYNTELGAQKSYIDTLGKRKYVLEQQLTVAPPNMQQRIRDEIDTLNVEISRNLVSARERMTTYTTFFDKLDKAIRDTDKGRALMSGSLPTAPGGYTATTEFPAEPPVSGLGDRPQAIPVPDSLGVVPEAPAAQPDTAAGAPAPPAQVTADSRTFIASLTPAQFEALPKDQQDAVLAAVNRERQANRDRANLLTSGAVAYDFLIGAPSNTATWLLNWTTDAIDLPRYARAIGLGDVTSTQIPMQGPTGEYTPAPATDWVKTLRSSSQPLTREQFLENLKANEQQTSVQEGKSDMQTAAAPSAAAPGVSLPTTPEGAAATQPALTMTPDVPIGDPANPRVAAITEYSNQSITERAAQLPARMGAAVQSDTGQRIINRARALGVDPTAAIAIYGIETSFGAKGGKSAAGAKGPLQVTDTQLQLIKNFFTGEDTVRQFDIPENLQQAAMNISSGADIDAGLLQLKMAELLGLEKNLWGAGYQGNMWDVKRAGAPVATHDAGKTKTAGLTNSDYNKLYIALYNEARQYVNIAPTTTTPQIGVGNSRTMREIEAAQTQLTENYSYTLNTISQEQQRNNAKRQEVLRQVEVARQFNDRVAYDKAIADLEAIDTLLLDGNNRARQAETETRIGFDKFNLARVDEAIRMAVMALDARNPKPFAEMVSRGTGMMVEIDVIEGEPPKFAVWQNNQLVSGKGYTLKQLKDQYLSPISQSYEAQRAALAAEERKFNSEQLAADLKLARDATLESIKASGEMEKQGWKEGKEAVDDAGRIIERWYTKGNQVIRMRIAPDREENGLVVKGGVVVEEVGGLR